MSNKLASEQLREFAKIPRTRLTYLKLDKVLAWLNANPAIIEWNNASIAGYLKEKLGFDVSEKTIARLLVQRRSDARQKKREEIERKKAERQANQSKALIEKKQKQTSPDYRTAILARAIIRLYDDLRCTAPAELEKIAYPHE